MARWAGFFSYGRDVPLPGFLVHLDNPEGKKDKYCRKKMELLALPGIFEPAESTEVISGAVLVQKDYH